MGDGGKTFQELLQRMVVFEVVRNDDRIQESEARMGNTKISGALVLADGHRRRHEPDSSFDLNWGFA